MVNFLQSVSANAGPMKLEFMICLFLLCCMVADIGERKAEKKSVGNYMVVLYCIAFVCMVGVIILIITYLIGGRGSELLVDIGDRPVILVFAIAACITMRWNEKHA